MKKIISTIIMLCSLAFTSMASDFSLNMGNGSLGGTIEMKYAYSNSLKARFNINGGGIDNQFTKDFGDLEYKAEADLKTIGLILDYYPFEGKFFTSAGIYYLCKAESKFDSRLDNDTKYQLGNTLYTGQEIGKITGSADLKTVCPYLGVGWDIPLFDSKKWYFAVDLGVLYNSKDFDVKLNSKNSVLKNNIDFINNLNAEKEKITDDLSCSLYPVVDFKIGFKF